MELPCDTRGHEQRIRGPVGHLAEHVVGVERAYVRWSAFSSSVTRRVKIKKEGREGKRRTGSPTDPTQIHVGVVVQVRQLRTHVLHAAIRVAATGLGDEGLAADLPQPVGLVPEVIRLVGDALRVAARGILVQILVHLEDKLVLGTVRVADVEQGRAGGGIEAADGVGVGAREEDELGGGAGGADGVDGGLEGVGPDADVEVVGLVHQAEDDVGLAGVGLGELGPEGGEVVVGGAALADDVAVPAGVVVDVDDAVGAGGQAGSHDVVVGGEEVGVERTAEHSVDEVLPADGEAEDIEAVISGEMVHLIRSHARRTVCATAGSL